MFVQGLQANLANEVIVGDYALATYFEALQAKIMLEKMVKEQGSGSQSVYQGANHRSI